MILYISGQMSFLKDHGFPAFNRAAVRLKQAGYEVINPAELDGTQDVSGWTWVDFMKRDLRILLDETDVGVAVLDNWQLSRGACEEVRLAHALRIPVLSIDQWIHNYARETVSQ